MFITKKWGYYLPTFKDVSKLILRTRFNDTIQGYVLSIITKYKVWGR
jgi:hypothetical protein